METGEIVSGGEGRDGEKEGELEPRVEVKGHRGEREEEEEGEGEQQGRGEEREGRSRGEAGEKDEI